MWKYGKDGDVTNHSGISTIIHIHSTPLDMHTNKAIETTGYEQWSNPLCESQLMNVTILFMRQTTWYGMYLTGIALTPFFSTFQDFMHQIWGNSEPVKVIVQRLTTDQRKIFLIFFEIFLMRRWNYKNGDFIRSLLTKHFTSVSWWTPIWKS